jgi:hypothetical protein
MIPTNARPKSARRRAVATLGAAALLTVAAANSADATTKIVTDTGWQSFITAGGIGGASTAGPWTFTTGQVTKVTVTDAFCHGDEFRVLDGTTILGQTTDVVSEFPECPFTLFFPALARADAALLDDGFSHGTFYLAPGSHALEFENVALWSETSSGTGAFFRVDTVALTKADCRDGGWADYGTLFDNQGDCTKVANTVASAVASAG